MGAFVTGSKVQTLFFHIHTVGRAGLVTQWLIARIQMVDAGRSSRYEY